MDAKNYFSELNTAAQHVFNNATGDNAFLGSIHDCSLSLQEWAQVLDKEQSVQLLRHSYEQVEMSGFAILLGLYRQGFVNLRLALEMLFGCVYFSSNKIDFIEWSKNKRDLSWSLISGARADEDELHKGVLSNRFISAFCPELLVHAATYQDKAKYLYRELSGFVHGNNTTWDLSKPALTFDTRVVEKYKACLSDFKNLAQFILCARFVHELLDYDKNILEATINDELKHLEELRVLLGGPVSI